MDNILPGTTFGNLTVIDGTGYKLFSFETSNYEIVVACRCNKCGNIVYAFLNNIQNGIVHSCPMCEYEDPCGRSKDPRLYMLWHSMISRCEDRSNKSYKFYGAKNITVCPEWHKYETFRDWAMENGYNTFAKYGECTLDRIDPTKGYSPDNCRFISMKMQAVNKSTNTFVTIDGTTATVTEFANAVGLTPQIVFGRRAFGKSIEESLFTIPKKYNTRNNKLNAVYFIDDNGRPISPEQYDEGNKQ